jgi:hypothetical protein
MGRAWLAVWPLLVAGVASAEDGDVAEAAGTTEAAPAEAAPADGEAAPADGEVAPASEPGAAPAPEAGAPTDPGEDDALPEAPSPEPEVAAPAPSTPVAEEPEPEADPIRDLDVRHRLVPLYPDELQVMYGQQAIRCTAEVWVDGHGAPQRIAMIDCPDGFHLAALSAMAKWRWEKPEGPVPEGGFHTVARTGFARRDKRYYPGVTYFRSPEKVTGDPSLPIALKSGKMPRYPRQVNAGDDVCLVEMIVDRAGNTTSPVIDDCAPPYRDELRKVVKTWKWWWRDAPGKGDTETVQAEVVFRL